MDTQHPPKFVHLADLGLSLHDSSRQQATRETLLKRGRELAEANGLRIFRVGKDAYVSAAAVNRLHHGDAA